MQQHTLSIMGIFPIMEVNMFYNSKRATQGITFAKKFLALSLPMFLICGSVDLAETKFEFSSASAAKGGNSGGGNSGGGGNGGGSGNGGGKGGGNAGGNSNAKNDNAGRGNNNAGNASARAKEVANARSAVGKAATAEAKDLAEKELAILEYELALQGLRLTDDLEVVNWNVEVPEQPPEGYEGTAETAEDTAAGTGAATATAQ